MRRLAPIGLVAACALLAACGGTQVTGTASPAEKSQAPAATTVSSAPATPSPTAIYTLVVEPGIHGVGADIQPGTYATGPSVHNCVWVRYDVMRNVVQSAKIGDSAQSVTVTILPTDYQFFSAGCGQWHYVG